MKHSMSQNAISAMLQAVNAHIRSIPPSYLFSAQIPLPISPELLNMIDVSSLPSSSISSEYLLQNYEDASRSAYSRRWNFELIDICANCWAHRWRGVKANENGPHSRVCPKCHFPRYEDDMKYYTKKLEQFDTKHKTKTKTQQLDRLKLVKSIADALPDYRHSSNLK